MKEYFESGDAVIGGKYTVEHVLPNKALICTAVDDTSEFPTLVLIPWFIAEGEWEGLQAIEEAERKMLDNY